MDPYQFIQVDRIVKDALELVQISSPTGNTREVADSLVQRLTEVEATVEVFEYLPNQRTVVGTYGTSGGGKTVLFNGHLDTVPLPHDPPHIAGGRIYGRGACDMKASLACFLEMIRVLRESGAQLNGRVVLVSNSLHESPGGRGEDLLAWAQGTDIRPNGVVVMEGAVNECTIAQFGSATFYIGISRDGEPSHQLYTPEGTPHPISVAAQVIQALDRENVRLRDIPVEDIGAESYFIGNVRSGEFYNQMPKAASLEGVRRYGPSCSFESAHQSLKDILHNIAVETGTTITLDFVKVRDGYRIPKDSEMVRALLNAVREVRGIELPLVGKQLVTDAGIFVTKLSAPTVCYGPSQVSAHGAIEYVEIEDLKTTTAVYLKLLESLKVIP